jgi:hypothetical protein
MMSKEANGRQKRDTQHQIDTANAAKRVSANALAVSIYTNINHARVLEHVNEAIQHMVASGLLLSRVPFFHMPDIPLSCMECVSM